MSFSAARLQDCLQSLPEAREYWVAFSGGMDSTVLLHALSHVDVSRRPSIHAIHINHGLHVEADTWAAHCARICRALDVPLLSESIVVDTSSGRGMEAAARDARYAAMAMLLPSQAVLLSAHHRDDQAETVLLQLLRGAGVAGLAGAAKVSRFAQGWLARPLLDWARSDLHAYAVANHLEWIDDPSNSDVRFDRNYLRHEVLPVLRRRWPSADKALARSAAHCGEAYELLETSASSLFAASAENKAYRLSVIQLLGLPRSMQRLLLRHWLRVSVLPLPDANRLDRIITEVAMARPDAKPRVVWPGGEIRRFRDLLYALPGLPAQPMIGRLNWRHGEELTLPAGLGTMRWGQSTARLPRQVKLASNLEIRFGEADGSYTPVGRRGRRSFKRLCQDWGIPPWLRTLVPLLYVDERLAAVGDYGVCEPFGTAPGGAVSGLLWERAAYLR